MPNAFRDKGSRRTRAFWILSIAALCSAREELNQGPKPEPTLWAPCPNNGRVQAEHRIVRTFQR
jgi:hypothetical protein